MSRHDVLRTRRALGPTMRFDDKGIREEARPLGADTYVANPFDLDQLEERLGGTRRGDQGQVASRDLRV